MLIRIVLLFLLIMVVLALTSGPGFRRFLLRLLGLDRDRR